MVKTLPDNELKAMPNPFWQYKFTAGDIKADEWQLSGIDVSGVPQMLLSLPKSSTNSSANHANSSPSLQSATTRFVTAGMMMPVSPP